MSDDYFATLRIPLIRGRTFTPADGDGASWVAVVSAGLARQLRPNATPDAAPIGARVKVDPNKPWATVVGVTLVVVGMRTLEEVRRSTPAIADRRLQMQLMAVFALIALAVSAIGVYGVSAYATEARRHEFGIRMALGAPRRRVLWLALRDGADVAALGVALGVPPALVLAWRLRELLYATAPYDPLTLGVVVGSLMLVVLGASLVPARRATHVDPASAMRSD